MADSKDYGDKIANDGGSSPEREIGELHDKEMADQQTTEEKVEALHHLADTLGEKAEGIAPIDDIELVMDKVNTMTVEDAKRYIADLLVEHEWDYNFSSTQRTKLESLLKGPTSGTTEADWELELKSEAAICRFYSPYPEVRAVTQPVDDPTIPCETIRAHLLGYLWACIAQFINSFFNSRFPQITFYSAVAQIFLYPCGKILQWILPDWGFSIGGKRHSLNPGPWSYKEQMLSTIIVDVSLTSAYCFWNIQTETVYYHDTWLTPGYKILLLLSTQLMGLGFAGLLRSFVVYPTQTIWPSILPTLALNRALLLPNKKETIHGWSMSRYKFFFVMFGAMFVYFWLPGYLFQGLSVFAWMSWIKPDNFNLGVITGSQLGFAINPIPTFDWNVIAVYFYPLIWPWWSYLQQYIGLVIGTIAAIAIYYTNTKNTAYLPPNSSAIFDNTGARYNITKVIKDGKLDEAAYQAYSPAYYAAGNLVVYSAFFAYYPLTFVFIILDQWRSIGRAYRKIALAAYNRTRQTIRGLVELTSAVAGRDMKQIKEALNTMMHETSSVYDGFDDPFSNMMRNYAEVPDWWFLSIVVVSFIFAIIVLTQYNLNTPVWTIFFVIGLNVVFLVPMTYLYAVAGTTEGLNVVTELIVGYALPGNPEALMFVKAFGYNINGQADYYIADLKMGHYAKIPPRAMFRGQLISACITAFVAYGVVEFVDGFDGICTPDQPANFTCAYGSQVYYSASVIWGAIGPKRIFSQTYPAMQYAFLLGFLLALVWWGLKRYGASLRGHVQRRVPAAVFKPLNAAIFKPISLLKNVHPSMLINGLIYLAPLNLSYATMGLYVSFFFMYWIKQNKTAWFEKYTYVLSAAFNGGVALSAIIIFFAVQYHPKPLSWWGNDIVASGVDGGAGQTALLQDLPEQGFFGSSTWY